VEVNGEQAHELYRYLKSRAKGLLGTESIKWNFTKFLIDKNGDIVHRFAPATTPSTLEARIQELLR
ncbi:MAG TPA: glutathione peroxidase, partial [Polyangiaceae bacterium]